MTLEEIEGLQTEILSCQQIAKVLGANPHTLHVQAMQDATKLGFPVICMGSRVKIPKRAFIKYMKGDKNG